MLIAQAGAAGSAAVLRRRLPRSGTPGVVSAVSSATGDRPDLGEDVLRPYGREPLPYRLRHRLPSLESGKLVTVYVGPGRAATSSAGVHLRLARAGLIVGLSQTTLGVLWPGPPMPSAADR